MSDDLQEYSNRRRFNHPSSKAARAKPTGKVDPMNAAIARHKTERDALDERHRDEVQRLHSAIGREQTARGDAPRPAKDDRGADMRERHQKERNAMRERHVAERERVAKANPID